MKYMKMIRVLTAAVIALMAFVGTASATIITEGPGDSIDVGDVIKATSTHSVTTGTIAITCGHSELEGTVVNAGGPNRGKTEKVEADITKLTFTNCVNHTVEVQKGGRLTIERIGGGKGTMYLSGTEITKLTHSLFLGTRHCIYVTNNTDTGTFTGGVPASLDVTAPIPQSPTDSLCGNDAEWHATYTVIQPGTLTIH